MLRQHTRPLSEVIRKDWFSINPPSAICYTKSMNITAPTKVTISPAAKQLILELIKGFDLGEIVIEDESNRKWFMFGAYDLAGKLCDRIKEIEEDRSAVLE